MACAATVLCIKTNIDIPIPAADARVTFYIHYIATDSLDGKEQTVRSTVISGLIVSPGRPAKCALYKHRCKISVTLSGL